MLLFIGTGCRGYEQDLVDLLLELLKTQRTVVLGAGKTESIVYQSRLARLVSVVHGSKLRQCHVRLVNDDQEFIREVVQQRLRRRPRCSSIHMP